MRLTSLVAAISVVLSIPALANDSVFRWSAQSDALTLDPHALAEGPTVTVIAQIYEPLVDRDADLALQPGLATAWEALDDTTWQFTLREGVSFHDGAAFTAEDVVFSLQRALSDTSNFRQRLKGVTSVEAVAPMTVRVTTDRPSPLLPNNLATIYMMDSEWAAANNSEHPQDYGAGEEMATVRQANGTGPYRLLSRTTGVQTEFERNPLWWGWDGKAEPMERIVFSPIANAATRTAALMSGEVDLILDVPTQDLERIRTENGFQVGLRSSDRTIFLGLDQSADTLTVAGDTFANPLKDRRVRESMLRSIDTRGLQAGTMRGFSEPAGAIVAPSVHGYDPERDRPVTVDHERAKALLEEAGHGDGLSLRLDCPNDRYANDEQLCVAIAAMLSRVNIDVELAINPKAIYFPKVSNGEVHFYLLGWGASTLDSSDHLIYLVQSKGLWNRTGYHNEALDRLVDDIAVELDTEVRDRMLDRAWATVSDDIVYIPLHHQLVAWAFARGFDIPVTANDSPRFKWVRRAPAGARE